jgi:hypothetical protein
MAMIISSLIIIGFLSATTFLNGVEMMGKGARRNGERGGGAA